MRTMKRKVVIITDGDEIARKTVEKVAQNVGACCISASAGNPTTLTGEEIVELIKTARKDPILVMLDDRGCLGKGQGERAMEYIAHHPEIEVIGAVAVASNSGKSRGVRVKNSVDMDGQLVAGPVDKEGFPEREGHHILEGDTVGVLQSLHIPTVIGIGDIGKMHGKDRFERGAKITTQAVEFILERNGFLQ